MLKPFPNLPADVLIVLPFSAGFLLWALCVILGYLVGSKKDCAGLSVLLTALLGPVGLLIVLCIPKPKELSPPRAISPSPTAYQISHRGKNFGYATPQRVRQLIAAGQLEETDLYFDPHTNDWVALDLMPNW